MTPVSAAGRGPVWSWNEWDPLEEVVVGRVENSVHPPFARYILGGVPDILYKLMFFVGGRRKWPAALFIEQARRELENLVRVLEEEGVRVRRPDGIDHAASFGSPWWTSRGHTTACPRDCFLVIGDEIIEAPMSWRSRTYERQAYYRLFKEYFDAGARWTSPPRPPLWDGLFDPAYPRPQGGADAPGRFLTNETEVVFDAADFVRCGRDLFVIRSNTTNRSGIAWVRRHLGPGFRVHELVSTSPRPMHIDTTFLPLAPGKALINPHRLDRSRLPPALASWDLLPAPDPVTTARSPMARLALMCSPWVSMNVLMLDEKRVLVERTQGPMIRALREWGFQPIPVPFLHLNSFGGGLHCATLDIRRRGDLRSCT
ncbi:MAG: amidinotransferase [Candidatus Riflebacteria bacterium]|nr:amidinotransferase [Candidatus Riflebacteria bacterium]